MSVALSGLPFIPPLGGLRILAWRSDAPRSAARNTEEGRPGQKFRPSDSQGHVPNPPRELKWRLRSKDGGAGAGGGALLEGLGEVEGWRRDARRNPRSRRSRSGATRCGGFWWRAEIRAPIEAEHRLYEARHIAISTFRALVKNSLAFREERDGSPGTRRRGPAS